MTNIFEIFSEQTELNRGQSVYETNRVESSFVPENEVLFEEKVLRNSLE